jgi:hypothetical protein
VGPHRVRLFEDFHAHQGRGRGSAGRERGEPSGLELLDRQVGISYSHAQFVSERGE